MVDVYVILKCILNVLLDGFVMDIVNCCYKILGEVKDYLICVVVIVGLMMVLVMCIGDSDVLVWVVDFGIVM